MGVCISCGKLSMDMSYGTFDRFRVKIAKSLNKNFGDIYENWMFSFGKSEDELNKLDKDFESICNSTDNLTNELFNFFIASDCEGEIDKNTSKQLLPLIKNLDDFTLGYIGTCPYKKDFVVKFFEHSVRYNAKIGWS